MRRPVARAEDGETVRAKNLSPLLKTLTPSARSVTRKDVSLKQSGRSVTRKDIFLKLPHGSVILNDVSLKQSVR